MSEDPVVLISRDAAMEIVAASVIGVHSGSLFGSFDLEANEIRVAEAVPGWSSDAQGLDLIGGYWEDARSVGQRPEVSPEQCSIWAAYIGPDRLAPERYVALAIVPESQPDAQGWAPPQVVAWLTQKDGPISTRVDPVRVRFEVRA